MHFQIKSLVLWPRNERHEPRVLGFTEGKLNVITGASKTGKSAVIPLIDYCLGADRCAVPVSTIRDNCSWFGVVVTTSAGEKLLARREPGDQQSTGDMFVLEAKTVEIPHTIAEKNTTAAQVKMMLDQLAGLSNLGFDPAEVADGFKGRPSFRDLVAFTFQPQNIVANPDVLFFKTDKMEHKEKLRTIFPYVLGAVTPDALARQWEIDYLVRELRRKQRELDQQRKASESWRAEVQNWVSEARDLGLLSAETASLEKRENHLASLDAIIKKTSADAQVSDSALDAAAIEAAELDKEESTISLRLAEVKVRLDNMVQLRSTVDDYTRALKKQRDRLELSRWLREFAEKTDARCPICGGSYDHSDGELDALCGALASVEADARRMEPVPLVFDKELVQVREEVRRQTDVLRAVRSRKQAVEDRSKRIRDERWQRAAVDRFLGRMEQALKVLKAPQGDPALAAEVDEMKARLETLKEASSDNAARGRREAALRFVSAAMARLLPGLNAEDPNAPAELNIDDLTIRVTRPNRRDYLWEIGSGANWLSYHVAVMLGLHELFLGLKDSPVPSFLVLDQPSQVYFPRTLAKETKPGDDPTLSDEDVQAVRKVFVTLADATRTNKGLQILVLDHASREVWGNIGDVHLVEEWRDGKALVPQSWLST